MLVGYERVSTLEQTLALQQDALRKAGCERIFIVSVSGAKWTTEEKVGLSEALEFMRADDTLVVWKLDRYIGYFEISKSTLYRYVTADKRR